MKSGLAKATIAVSLTMTAAFSPAMAQSHKLLGTESNLNQQEPQADDQSRSKHKQGAPAIAVPPIYFEIPSNHNEETQRPGANSKEGQGYDLGTIAALLAAFFGALSFGAYAYQAYLMRGQLKAAVDAANAAKASANAATDQAMVAIGVELPKLLLCKLDFADMGAADLRARLQFPKVSVDLKNYGRTPAFISQQSLEVECFDIVLPPVEYPRSHVVLPGTVVEGREVYELGASRPSRLITDDEIDGILSWTKKLAVYGFVAYSDFLSRRHITRFYGEIFIHNDGYTWTEGNPPPDYTESL